MTSQQRSRLEALEQRVKQARYTRDPFELLADIHRITAESRELERELERDLAERGRAAGLSVQVSIQPPELRRAV